MRGLRAVLGRFATVLGSALVHSGDALSGVEGPEAFEPLGSTDYLENEISESELET